MKKHLFHHLHFWTLMSVIVLLLSACGKDDDGDVKPVKELLTSSKWVLEEFESDDLDDISLALLAAFFEDYEVTYKADGSYVAKYPVLGDLGNDEGTWELSSDEKLLIHNKGDEEAEEQFTLVSVTENNLTVSFEEEDEESGTSYTVTMKFKH